MDGWRLPRCVPHWWCMFLSRVRKFEWIPAHNVHWAIYRFWQFMANTLRVAVMKAICDDDGNETDMLASILIASPQWFDCINRRMNCFLGATDDDPPQSFFEMTFWHWIWLVAKLIRSVGKRKSFILTWNEIHSNVMCTCSCSVYVQWWNGKYLHENVRPLVYVFSSYIVPTPTYVPLFARVIERYRRWLFYFIKQHQHNCTSEALYVFCCGIVRFRLCLAFHISENRVLCQTA